MNNMDHIRVIRDLHQSVDIGDDQNNSKLV